jgi:hypothetical protein
LLKKVEAHRFVNPVTAFSMRFSPSGATFYYSVEPVRDIIRDAVHDAMRSVLPCAQGFQTYQPFVNKWVLDHTADIPFMIKAKIRDTPGPKPRRYCVEVLKDLDTVVIRWD